MLPVINQGNFSCQRTVVNADSAAVYGTENTWRMSVLNHPSTAQGTLWKEELKESKSWKTGRSAVKCCLRGMIQPWQTRSLRSCRAHTRLGLLRFNHRSRFSWGPTLSLLNYWLMKGFEGSEVITFNFISTAEPTRLQWIVPKPWSHRQPWLKPVGHQNKTNKNMGERFVGRQDGIDRG